MLAYLTFFSVALLQIVSTVQGEEPNFEWCTVVVSFFSGRDNPQFIFKKNQELAALMVEARDKSWFGLPAQMPFRLGYRGILVEDKRTKFAGLLVGPESADLQLELLKRVQLKAGDRKEIENDIKKINFEEAPKIKVRAKRHAPSYRPYDWNAFQPLYRRQRCNSCYDYVNLNPTDKRSEPGIGGGRGYRVNAAGGAIDNPYTADNIRDAALRDRLLVLNPHPAPGDDVPRPPRDAFHHLVALVVRPATRTQGGDYHWYRLDANGMWSHKPGESQVSQTDNGRNPITDPRVSNNGAYQFAYFMESNAFTVLIRGNFVCGA